MIQKDQHDSIDFTDNSIAVLGNLPLVRRLRTLHLGNNRIISISPNLHLSCPGLNTLILTNNNVAQLGDLEPLKEFRYLHYLSLMGNPVRERKYYREWIIFRCKSLRVLDFQRIRDKVSASFQLSKESVPITLVHRNDRQPKVYFSLQTCWRLLLQHNLQPQLRRTQLKQR